MSESVIQMQRKLVDVTSKLEKVEAELAKLAQQKPFGRYVKIVDPVDKNKHTYGVDYYSGFYVADLLDKEVYAAPVPAPDVPNDIIPEGDDFNGTTPHLIQCIESLVRLDAKGVLVPHGIGRDASKLLTAAANRLRQQAPAVPEEWRVLAAMCVDSLDAYERIGPGCQLDGCDMIHASILEELGEKARALLQSAEGCSSQAQNRVE